jgi:uncharacterized protein (DUF4415 family)
MPKKRVSKTSKSAGKKTVRGKISSLRAAADGEGVRSATESHPSGRRVGKKRITLFLDADVLASFQESGPGYQTRINQALRKVMRAEMKASRG